MTLKFNVKLGCFHFLRELLKILFSHFFLALQISRTSALLTWTAETGSRLMPVQFFKVQFREFRRGGARSVCVCSDSEYIFTK